MEELKDINEQPNQENEELLNEPKAEHIELLLSNPEFAEQFDAKYGAGASARYLPTQKEEVNLKQTQKEELGTDEPRGVTEDIIKSGLAGFFKEAPRETLETLQGFSNWANDKLNLGGIRFSEDGISFVSNEEMKKEDKTFQPLQSLADAIPETAESDTTAGAMTRGVTQFVGGLVGAKKFTNGINLFKKQNRFVKSSIDGAIADFFVFDEHEARFTDFIIDVIPEAEDSYLGYLASDEEDGFFEGKFKNVLEGSILGVVAESIFRGAKYVNKLRKARKNNNLDEAQKLAEKRSKEILEDMENITEAELKYVTSVNKGIPFNLKSKVGAPSRAKLQETINNGDYIKTIRENMKKVRLGEMDYDDAFDIPFNLSRMGDNVWEPKTMEDVVRVTKAVFDNVEEVGKKADDVQTFDDVLRESDELIEDPIATLGRADQLSKQLLEKGAPLRTSLRIVYKGLVRQWINTSKQFENGLALQKDVDNIADLTIKTLQLINDIGKGAGRTLNAGNIIIKQEPQAIKEVTKLIEKNRFKIEKGDLAKLNQKVAKADNPRTVTKMLKDIVTLRAFGINQINEYWINALLSNPKTHMINMTANLMTALVRPTEQMIGATFTLDGKAFVEALSTASGIIKYFNDSLQASIVSFKKGDSLLDKGLNKVDLPEQALGQGKVGQFLRSPTRLLTAEDEFFKQINYRSKAYGMAVSEAWAKGISKKKTITLPNGKKVSEFDQYVEEQMENAFKPSGEGANSVALKYAQENTFTKELGAKTMGGQMQNAVNTFPLLRQIMPFVRTPVNIVRFTADRSPIGLFRKSFKEGIKDPNTRASAIGQMALGNSIFVGALVLANNEIITGGYAKEKYLRRQQMDSGWQPYSFYIGGKYYSYERLDPFGMFFGLMADYSQISAEATEEDRLKMADANTMALIKQMATFDNLKEIGLGGVMSTIQNLSNKTYLKGLADAIDVLNSGEPRKLERWINQKAGSMVPSIVTNIINDPLYREARTITDTIKTKTGFFGDVDPSYNVMGEIRSRDSSFLERFLLPTSVTENKGDMVMDEMVRLGEEFRPIQQKGGLNGNIKISEYKNEEGTTAWKRWNEITGTMKIGGKTLREALEKEIQSTKYNKATDKPAVEDLSYSGSKKDRLNRIIKKYKLKAQKQLFKEGFKSENGVELKQAFINDKRNSNRAKKGKELLPLL